MGKRRKARRFPRPRKRPPKKKPAKEPEPKRSPFYTYGPLACGPLLGGSFVAGVVYHKQSRDIQKLERKLEIKETNFQQEAVRKAITLGLTLYEKNPELKKKLLEKGKMGFSEKEKIEIGLDVIEREPEMVNNLLADILAAKAEIVQLRSEIAAARDERPTKTLSAFGYSTGVLYAIVLFAVVYKRAVAFIKSKRAAAKKAQALPKDGNQETADEKKQAGRAEEKTAPVRTLELAAHASPSFSTVDSNTRRKRKDPVQKKEHGNIFRVDTFKALRKMGIDPDETEKALIKAFRILASNIIIGERHAELKQVKKRLRLVFRDNQKVSDFLNFLQREGMLRYHQEGECISLEPNPVSAIGSKMMSDILAKQQKMQRASGRDFAPLI